MCFYQFLNVNTDLIHLIRCIRNLTLFRAGGVINHYLFLIPVYYQMVVIYGGYAEI